MKFFLVFIIFITASWAWANNATKSFFEDDIFFFMPKDVIKAYEGSWAGSQKLYLRGRHLGDMKITNENKFLGSSALSCVGTARMADEIIDTKATIIVLDNTLYMMSKDDASRDVIYQGYIKSNSVEWYRTEKFFAYDYTKDVFIKNKDSLNIKTYSVKPYVPENSMLMYLEYKGSLSKNLTPKVKLSIDPTFLDISRLKI